jgi:aspartate carbamoyltransferase regulatory subunit
VVTKSNVFCNIKQFNIFLTEYVYLFYIIPRARGSLLRHYATSRKIVGSIPDEVIGFFNWPNPSCRTMALVSTQPLTEMSIRNLPGAKGRPAGA